jgi:hypothetical protein
MFGLAQLRYRAVDLGARLQQLVRLQHIPTVLTLVAAGAFRSADIAGTFDIAVGQEPAGGGGIPLWARLGIQVSVFHKRQEDALRNLKMVFSVGRGEQVVSQAGFLKKFQKAIVKIFVHFFDWSALCIGAQGHRRPVGVGARNHQHVVALQTVIARVNIGWQISAGDIADVDLCIGVRPGNCD